MDGGGVPELEALGDIRSGAPHPEPTRTDAIDVQGAIGVDLGDVPAIAVLDPARVTDDQAPVVVAGDDHVAPARKGAVL